MMKNYYELYNDIIGDILKSSSPPPFDKNKIKNKIIEKCKEEFLARRTISFQTFADREFNNDSEVETLCQKIKKDYPRLAHPISTGKTEWLNKFLKIGNFYDSLNAKHKKIKFDNYIQKLIGETSLYRRNYFDYLGDYKQMNIIRLNRLLLEAIYPDITPKFIDYFYSAKVSYYVGDYAKEAFRDVFIEDIEKRYFLDYRVADMALQYEGMFDLMQIDYGKLIGLHEHSNFLSRFSQHLYHRAVINIPLLIVGETGTGKELCARAIHLISKCRQAPFIEINCAAIPENLLEAELFGVIKNYPGMHNPEPLDGKIELANNGIIFLDEIGKMPKNLQAKILKVVEDRKVNKLGSNEIKEVNVRFIAAVQPRDVKDDNILPDLKYRLGYPDVIKMPTLNERINELGEELLNISLRRTIKKIGAINPNLMIDPILIDALRNRSYEGNFRELEGIYRMAILNAKAEATPQKNWSIKYDDFCTGMYVKQISEKNVHGLNQSFVKDQPHKNVRALDNFDEEIPLKSIVQYAESQASKIIEKKVMTIIKEGRNIKDVLIMEGISEKEYQNILGKIKRYMGKGINDIKKMNLHSYK